jgi:CRISPR-associated protein Csb3
MAEPSASLALDPLNPGHYFACCGLFELASRLAPEVLAWFEQKDGQWYFHLAHTPPLADLLSQITAAEITRLTLDDADPPLSLGDPFNVRLDWWKNTNRNTSSLQAWKCDPRTCAYVISRSMQTTVNPEDGENLFFSTRVAYDMTDSAKKVEPFYFDANRAPNSVARDVGFSCNDLKLKTPAAPAVELLTLIGLQRAIPRPSGIRLFDFHLWTEPLPISLIPAAVNGLLPDSRKHAYRFESLKRSDYLKAFLPANPIGGAP